jgi:intein/homing endonuclease
MANQDFASIHAYLCADGYVTTGPATQKHKYYYIGLRNMNVVLLKDFQNKFSKVFGITPIITKNVDRCKIQNKELTLKLLKGFGSFHSDKWTLPNFDEEDLKSWLRSYFDCDGWASSIKGKDRKIGLESINRKGIIQIQKVLLDYFGIESTIKERKNRSIWSLTICGKDDLEKFQKHIGFLHPKKVAKLEEALNSYVDYNWKIPLNRKDFVGFLVQKGKVSQSRNEARFNSIVKQNLINLQSKLLSINVKSRLNGPWKNPYGSVWYCLSINLGEYKNLVGGETKSGIQ